jgi:hypothetical protein
MANVSTCIRKKREKDVEGVLLDIAVEIDENLVRGYALVPG